MPDVSLSDKLKVIPPRDFHTGEDCEKDWRDFCWSIAWCLSFMVSCMLTSEGRESYLKDCSSL
jgi:hypothetical protein